MSSAGTSTRPVRLVAQDINGVARSVLHHTSWIEDGRLTTVHSLTTEGVRRWTDDLVDLGARARPGR